MRNASPPKGVEKPVTMDGKSPRPDKCPRAFPDRPHTLRLSLVCGSCQESRGFLPLPGAIKEEGEGDRRGRRSERRRKPRRGFRRRVWRGRHRRRCYQRWPAAHRILQGLLRTGGQTGSR